MKARLKGKLRPPGDKSISHRALIFAALTAGRSTVSGLSPAQDCRSSMECLKALGLKFEPDGNSASFSIECAGPESLQAPARLLDAGNSGTTIRLMAGLVAGRPFEATFDGDSSLRSRPMSRVLTPLTQMGATVSFSSQPGCAPFKIAGGKLNGLTYTVPVASAQVQTALLLAGLQAEGETTVSMPGTARDHTLKMFEHLKVPHKTSNAGTTITVSRLRSPVASYQLEIPADISSAAFFMVAAAILPGSSVLLSQVGINPGRLLIVDALKRMGADISLRNERSVSGEPIADIEICYAGRLRGATISGAEVASGIDEIPILALAGAFCQGTFTVRDAAELRVKESDRLKAIVSNMRAAGASVTEHPDGFDIAGAGELSGGCDWQTFGDHRLAMTGLVANLACEEPVAVDDTACAAVSYPAFQEDLNSLSS
jgi:3-phosphoshikimate 1-carboxyvinyltransferase